MDENELQFVMKMQDQTSAVLDGIEHSFKDVSSVIQQQMQAMQALTAALQSQARNSTAATSAAQAHAAGLKAVGDAANAASSQLKAHGDAAKSAGDAHKAHGAAVKEAGEHAKEAAEHHKGLVGQLSEVTTTAKEAVEALVALYATNEMAKAAIEASEELEHTIRAIGAASGLARGEVEELQESLAKMSQKSGFAGLGQLEGLAKIGATLSTSREEIEQFAVAIGKITDGSNFERVGDAIAQLLAQTNEGPEKVTALADALGALGRQARGGVSNLTEVSSTLTRFTAGMNISSQTIVGYAATFNKLFGPEMARMGAAQFGVVLQNIAKEAREGGDGLADLAERVGMTYEAMRKLGQEHPEEVARKILQVTNAIKGSGGNPTDFLKQFGLGDGRALQQMTVLAQKYKELQANIDKAQHPEGGADAFNAEALTKYQNAVTSLATAWEELKVAFGKSFTPVATAAFNTIATVLGIVKDEFNDLPGPIQTVVSSFVILAPAVGGVAFAIGVMVRAFREFKEALIVAEGLLGLSGAFTGVGNAAREGAVAVAEGAGAMAVAVEGSEARIKTSVSRIGMILGQGLKGIWAITNFIEAGKGAWQFGKDLGYQIDSGHGAADFGYGLGGMLPSSLGGDYFQGKLKQSMQGEKDRGQLRTPHYVGEKPAEGEHEGGEHAENGHRPADHDERQRGVSTFSARNSLQDFSPSIKSAKEYADTVEHLQIAIEKMDDATKAALSSEIAGARQALELRKAELDPLNKMADDWRQAMMSARAYTKAQQEAAAIEKQVFDARREAYKRGEGDAGANRAEQFVRTTAPQTNRATSDTAYAKEAEGMYRQLAAASAITQTEKDRLAVEQQIAKWQQDTTYTQTQITQLTKILELTQQWSRELQQISQLNPQASAISKYNDDLAVLNKRLQEGKVSQQEFNREKMALDQQSLAQRNPLGNIAQKNQEELDSLRVTGRYREADVKTLQQINELKHQGIVLDEQQKAALSGSNRSLQDVKDAQAQMQELTQSFGSSMNTAITQAFERNRHWASNFGLSIGKAMTDMAIKNIFKNLDFSGMAGNSLFGGLFGSAKAANDNLAKAGASQMATTMASAQQEIASAQINIANATMAAGLTNQGAAANGAPGALPGPAGTNLPGSTGAAATQLISPRSAANAAPTAPIVTGTGITNVPSTIATTLAGAGGAAGLAAAGGAASAAGSTVAAASTLKTSLSEAAPLTQGAPGGLPSSFGSSLAPRLPGNGVGTITPADWTSTIKPGMKFPSGYDDQLKTFGGTPSDDWRTDFGHTGFQIQSAGMGQNKDLVAGLTALGKGQAGGAAGGANPFGDLGAAKSAFGSGQASVFGAQGMPFPQQRGGAWGNMPAPQQFGGGPQIGSGGDFYHAVMMHESGGKNIFNGGNPNSAAGYYQFMPQTWKGVRDQNPQLGLPPKAIDASFQQQTAAYQQFTKGNVDALQAAGLPVTDKNVFLGSWFGPNKGANFLKQMQKDPNQSAASLLPKEASQNTHDFYDKNGNPLSLQQFYDKQTRTFGNGNTTGFGPKTPDPRVTTKLEQTSSLDQIKARGVDTMSTGSIANAQNQMQQVTQQQAQQATEQFTKMQEQVQTGLKDSTQAFQTNFGSLGSSISKTSETALGGVGDMGSFGQSISGMLQKLQSGGGGGGMGGFGGLFGGGGGGGGGFMDFGGGDFAAFHSGGVVGSAAGGYLSRRISVSAFRGAPKFHDGLNSDEFPAVLQRGERVLTNVQEQRTTSIVDKLADAVQMSKGSPSAQHVTPAAQRAAGSRINMVVNVKDANSFRLSQSQIMAQAHSATMRSAAKHN